MNKAAYLAAITAPQVNDLLRSVADEIKLFDMACDLLVCGFDEDTLPVILDVQSPGVVNDMTLTVGFQAIGSGWEKASARLLLSEHKRTHSIERVLYDCFEARVFAEMTPGVGYEWDATVIAGGQCTPVPERIKAIIEQVLDLQHSVPFLNGTWMKTTFLRGTGKTNCGSSQRGVFRRQTFKSPAGPQ